MKKLFLLLALISINITLSAQLVPLSVTINHHQKINYLLYTPSLQKASSPLVVFLHGGGESGDDLNLVKRHGLPKLIAQGRDFPFHVLAPQNPYKKGFWDDRMIDEMVDDLIDSLNIDKNKIYLVGMSRGGYGVWRMAINNPDKYAAMISICAAAIPIQYTTRVSTMPIWFFHGQKDDAIPVEQTIAAYEKMKTNNSKVKMTLYPEAKHDSWTETFENDEIYDWLLSHSLMNK
jgi:predicted peptidase